MIFYIVIRLAISLSAWHLMEKSNSELKKLYFDPIKLQLLEKWKCSNRYSYEIAKKLIRCEPINFNYSFAVGYAHEVGHCIDHKERPIMYMIRARTGGFIMKLVIYYLLLVTEGLSLTIILILELFSTFVILSTEYKASKKGIDLLKSFGVTRIKSVEKNYFYSLLTYI